jgi:hypothetical protein
MTTVKTYEMTDAQLQAYKKENMVSSDVNTLELYEGDYRLYGFKECTGHTMSMGNHKYTYKRRYELYRGEKFVRASSTKMALKDLLKHRGIQELVLQYK